MFTLLFRYCNICSSYRILQEELSKFKGFLLQNGYPERFLDHCFRTFLSKVSDSPIKQLTAPKLIYNR